MSMGAAFGLCFTVTERDYRLHAVTMIGYSNLNSACTGKS